MVNKQMLDTMIEELNETFEQRRVKAINILNSDRITVEATERLVDLVVAMASNRKEVKRLQDLEEG